MKFETSKRKIALTFLVISLFFVCFGLTYRYTVTAQDKNKIFEIQNKFSPPIEISSVESNKGLIETNKKFSAAENWLKGLKINIRNTSEKAITYIAVSVRFPRPENQQKLDLVFPLSYGENPLPNEDGKITENKSSSVMPQENIQINLTDKDYDDILNMLKERGYPLEIDKVRIYVTMIGYNDDTVWMGGDLYKNNKERPGKLIPLKKN